MALAPGTRIGRFEIVGWLGNAGRPQMVEGDGDRHFAMPQVAHGRSIGAIWGSQTCEEQVPVRADQQGSRPPLCTRHEHLSERCLKRGNGPWILED